MNTNADVFLGLGGNIGDTKAVLLKAVDIMRTFPLVSDVLVSSFYLTSPVSEIPQAPYINAVCRFRTEYSLAALFEKLQRLEAMFSLRSKQKNAPRVLDIDILFFDKQAFNSPKLEVPHPRWKERLFVLRPLADLVETVTLPCGEILNISSLIDNFPHLADQWVSLLPDDKVAIQDLILNKVVGGS